MSISVLLLLIAAALYLLSGDALPSRPERAASACRRSMPDMAQDRHKTDQRSLGRSE
jgi:hypothetical protein